MGLLDWFKKNKEAEQAVMDEGLCPNCWGRQEYQGQFREMVQDKSRDILNGDPASQKAFVQKFVQDNLTGIQLKRDGDYLVCPSCKDRHHVGDGHNH